MYYRLSTPRPVIFSPSSRQSWKRHAPFAAPRLAPWGSLTARSGGLWSSVVMVSRIGEGVRLGRHAYIGMSVPLRHARRLSRQNGHGSGDPIQVAVGAVFLLLVFRGCRGLAVW